MSVTIYTLSDFENIKYGVAMARKGGASKNNIFTTFSLKQVEEFLFSKKKNII